jgi:hypothetical protein
VQVDVGALRAGLEDRDVVAASAVVAGLEHHALTGCDQRCASDREQVLALVGAPRARGSVGGPLLAPVERPDHRKRGQRGALAHRTRREPLDAAGEAATHMGHRSAAHEALADDGGRRQRRQRLRRLRRLCEV